MQSPVITIAYITTTYPGCADTSNFVPLEIKGVQAGLQIVQDHLCFQSPVILKDVSVLDPGNSIVSRSWDFGDGIIQDAGIQVPHAYLHPGQYPVKLTVKDASGCSASSTDFAYSGAQGGMPVTTGTYVYFIEMECPAGGIFTRQGSVVLIR
jgi:hypothetical protein